MLRRRYPLICGVGSLAYYLLHLYEIVGASVPDISATAVVKHGDIVPVGMEELCVALHV